jgi:hypothetical protein
MSNRILTSEEEHLYLLFLARLQCTVERSDVKDL